MLAKAKRPLSGMHEFVLQFADTAKPADVRSSHALDMLADIYAEDEGRRQDAEKVRKKKKKKGGTG